MGMKTQLAPNAAAVGLLHRKHGARDSGTVHDSWGDVLATRAY
ncbi:hypothetical protein OG250_25885 [Streptomyces sp. NBC_00487]|nr:MULTISPECIES: hypothetical protein [unclassified Streptomyces]WRY97965.1 hypothetical protein OG889_26665 [Streptomyces sp. NBC_00481]